MLRPRRAEPTSTVALVVAVVAALALVPAGVAVAGPKTTAGQPTGAERTLQRYAEDTWASFAAMTDDDSGLPSDRLNVDGTLVVQTSTTNIGSYMSASGSSTAPSSSTASRPPSRRSSRSSATRSPASTSTGTTTAAARS